MQQYENEVEYCLESSSVHNDSTNEMAENNRRLLVVIEGCSFNNTTKTETHSTTTTSSTIQSKKRRKQKDLDPVEEKLLQIIEKSMLALQSSM